MRSLRIRGIRRKEELSDLRLTIIYFNLNYIHMFTELRVSVIIYASLYDGSEKSRWYLQFS